MREIALRCCNLAGICSYSLEEKAEAPDVPSSGTVQSGRLCDTISALQLLQH